MQLLRKVSAFGASIKDMKQIYTTFVTHVLETSSSVWHKSLTIQNKIDLREYRNLPLEFSLGNKYITYDYAFYLLGMESLRNRREYLFKMFPWKA